MRFFSVIAVLFLYVLCTMPVIGFAQGGYYEPEPEFFTGAGDVPLMRGLIEAPEGRVVFDKPEGDITEVMAYMNGLSEKQVLVFYHESLPSFGWSRVDNYTFFRKAETLTLSFDEIDSRPYLKIMVRPSL